MGSRLCRWSYRRTFAALPGNNQIGTERRIEPDVRCGNTDTQAVDADALALHIFGSASGGQTALPASRQQESARQSHPSAIAKVHSAEQSAESPRGPGTSADNNQGSYQDNNQIARRSGPGWNPPAQLPHRPVTGSLFVIGQSPGHW